MKGADQCPRCASTRWAEAPQAITTFYARVIRVCGNCATAWEPFEVSALLDQSPPSAAACSSFVDPCNNCAFRKGSPEQKDPERWAELMATLGWTSHFYCHKGVPLDLTPSTPGMEKTGFHYPRRKDGTPDTRRLRHCRGFLNWLSSQPDPFAKVPDGTPDGANQHPADAPNGVQLSPETGTQPRGEAS